ncbi:MAG: phenylalanine--tRNA ligase subunit beta [Rickettsiaceae bacterium]|nr:phenylalanine--tRNA ligase subunit beta [Rickettsiaceae bacterium]
MKFTYNWLQRFLDTKLSPDEIAQKLTDIGIEVESMENPAKDLEGFTVAYIEEAAKHPDADKLRLCKVVTGKDVRQVVCGAPNARAGIKVVLADVGCVVPSNKMVIKDSKIRGVESFGMLCSYEELCINIPSDGIIELDQDANIGEAASKWLGLDDVVYDVSVTPNRGDWLGVCGIARDLAAIDAGILREEDEFELHETFSSDFNVEIKSDLCSLFSFVEIRGLTNSQSPKFMQNLLKSVGISPVSAIVDITNYFSISYARPLHAYDRAKIQDRFIVEELKSPALFEALNSKQYKLESDLVVRDEISTRAIAGIIGSQDSKCEEETTSIILECAAFDKVKVATCGRRHNIITDARLRFERGVDDQASISLLKRAAGMIVKICGGSASHQITVGTSARAAQIEFDAQIVEKRIGLDLSLSEISAIIQKLGFKIIKSNNNSMLLEIPSWRHDVNCPEVIAEEVARMYGYNKIPASERLEPRSFSRLLTPVQKRSAELRRCAASLGYNEIVSWSFMNSKKAQYFTDLSDEMFILNPISKDLDYMRPSIIPNLLQSVATNNNRSIPNTSFFEIGPVFSGLGLGDEALVLSGILSGNRVKQTYLEAKRDVDIYDIKGDLERIIYESGFDIRSLKLSEEAPSYFHPGRSGSYKLGKNTIAFFGEIHPATLELMDIKVRACAFELFLSNLPTPRQKMGRKSPASFSAYQMIERDYAFIFDKTLKVGDLLKSIETLDKFIKNVEIFDVYSGNNIDQSTKSIGFRVSIQSETETLTESQIEELNFKVINLCNKMGGAIRG